MLERLLTLDDFERAAAAVLPRAAYDHDRLGVNLLGADVACTTAGVTPAGVELYCCPCE